jgi:selenocysteine lyase/cysteine desulfurase
MQRRDLFGLAGVAFAQSALPAGERDENYWRMLRRQFPLRENLIYVNAANVCPASLPVLDQHQKYLRDFEADPSFQNRAKFGPLREAAREKAAKFLGASANEIAFTRNTSEASNLVVHGLDLNPGDEVVVVADNHPSNYDSWKNQAQRRKFQIVEVAATQRASGPEEIAAKVEKALTPRTKVLAVTHVTSTTGVLYPAAELAKIARSKGIWFHLDGAQSAGMIQVDLGKIACDSYATSSHKWLMGPLEAGILFVASAQRKRLWPSIVSVGYSGESAQGARAFEAYGQRDDARLAAMGATIDFLETVGMAHAEARIRQLAGRLMSKLEGASKIQLRTNRAAVLSAGVVKVDLPGVDLRALDAKLYAQQGMAFSVTAEGPMRGMRVSPHIYNSLEEMDAIAEAFLKA